jgi:hypothetical protein
MSHRLALLLIWPYCDDDGAGATELKPERQTEGAVTLSNPPTPLPKGIPLRDRLAPDLYRSAVHFHLTTAFLPQPRH